jgi:hypothetical protein
MEASVDPRWSAQAITLRRFEVASNLIDYWKKQPQDIDFNRSLDT